jgi:hypothetical protein
MVISGNTTGVQIRQHGEVKSYGDNYLDDNKTPIDNPGGTGGTWTSIGRQ